jgi:hypothetical protein
MTVQERKERAIIKRKKQVAKQKMFLLLITLFVITLGSIIFGSIFSSAKNPNEDIPRYKYYKSIEIESGDSLWSISKQYCDSTDDIREYMNELKELNALTSDYIQEGQHLIVAYYDSNLK